MAGEVRQGDCLEVVRGLAAGSMDLVYVDPPFFTQKTHSLVTRDRTTKFEFSDVWKSRAEYIGFLRARVHEFRRVLKTTGSLFFHCDTNASHHIRGLLDDLFGEGMFRSEIIWHYRRWSNSQRNPLPSHQTIFFYSKTDDYQYHQLFDNYSPSTNVDQILQRRQRDEHGKAVYARDENGNIVHDGHKKGVPVSDVWDIPFLNPKAKERVGYPTQKPILLLERIVALVTSPGGLVLDPFCGSGTTLVAADLLGRNSLGIDVAAEAVELARQRLAQPVKTSSELLRKGRESYVQSDEEALAWLHGLPLVPVQRNRGIDAILSARPGEIPILIRVQRRGEGVADAAELLHSAGQSKQPATMVLVVTDSQPPAGLFNLLPPDVLLVNSIATELLERFADRGLGKSSH
ncbi:MAG: site-specific DNA-methyltransferase [Chloroflexi bacterium]|nr:site-specific DNA-methyltransferase [Chloroflexota bacterium]